MNTSTIDHQNVNGVFAVDPGRYPAPVYGTREYAANGYRTPAYGPAVTGRYRPQPTAARPVDERDRDGLDDVRYWVGVGITAAIVALIGVIGLVVGHGILGVPVLVASGATLTAVSGTVYGFAAAGIAVLAGALYAAMLRVAPRPGTYYGWIAAVVTLLAVLLPFTTAASPQSQIALALMNLGVGVAIGALIPLAANTARS